MSLITLKQPPFAGGSAEEFVLWGSYFTEAICAEDDKVYELIERASGVKPSISEDKPQVKAEDAQQEGDKEKKDDKSKKDSGSEEEYRKANFKLWRYSSTNTWIGAATTIGAGPRRRMESKRTH